ncbi:hypothetical protein EDB83DRAFT_2552725, partial [Lactarius deliciosus]
MVGFRSRLELTPRPCAQVTGLAARTAEGRTVGQRDVRVANRGFHVVGFNTPVGQPGLYNKPSMENMPDLMPVTGRAKSVLTVSKVRRKTIKSRLTQSPYKLSSVFACKDDRSVTTMVTNGKNPPMAQITYIASMSTTSPISNGVSGVTSHRVGRSLIDVIRIIAAGVALRYYFTSRSRGLLQQSYASLPQEKYKCASKDLLKVAKLASRRAVDGNIIAQARGGGGATSTLRNPFNDPHAAPGLTDVSNPNLVEMPSIRSEPTGELHARDAFTQQFIATFPPEVVVGDGECGLVPIRSSHEILGSRSDIDDGMMDSECRF